MSLTPNKPDILAHLTALFPPAFVHRHPDAKIEIAYGLPEKGPNTAEWFSAFDLERAADFAAARSADHNNVYVGAALRRGDVAPFGRADDEDFLAAAHGWIDIDGAGDCERADAALKELQLEPSMVVTTGTTPHRRMHAYVALKDGVADGEQLRAANKALRSRLGGDPVHDPSRVMRLAGTISYPSTKKQQERGYVEELVTLRVGQNVRAHPVEHIISIGGGTSSASRKSSLGFDLRRSDDDITALLEKTRTAGEWHVSMRDAIASMIGRGWEDLAICHTCGPYCERGANDPDLTPMIEKAREKWNKPDPGHPPPPATMKWHDNAMTEAIPRWLVKKMLPEVGVAIMPGQWGAGKTFMALHLADCVWTEKDFAGQKICRRGGTLFVACEAASDVPVRLRGITDGRKERNPFAWIDSTTPLLERGAAEDLIQHARRADAEMRATFGAPLVLLEIDTMAAAAGFTDENSAAEGARTMSVLNRVAQTLGILVLAVDHFGKETGQGTRGTTAKESGADAVLAVLADKDKKTGNVSDRRLNVRKVRGAREGAVLPFELRGVCLGQDKDGDDVTTCVVDFELAEGATRRPAADHDRWPSSAEDLRRALLVTLDQGRQRIRPFGDSGPRVEAVALEGVRAEFYQAYPATGDAKQQAGARRQAWNRQIKVARERALVATREVGGVPA